MAPKISAPAVLLAASVFLCCGGIEGAPRQTRDAPAKLAILVDKVMQPQAKDVTQEWMVKETAEAGFNVLSPRRGYARFDEVEQVAQWCRKYDIRYMPWMRGTLAAAGDSAARGKRLVWASGIEQPLWSPSSDELWSWLRKHILEYARIGRRNPHLMGVFLDFENYAAGSSGKLYPLSYDEDILQRFATAQGIELPRLVLDERHGWLQSQGLHEAFGRFQVADWRARARDLREAIDQVNPSFQVAVYPVSGDTPFMVEAVYSQWATEAAPIILADSSTYGRASNELSHAQALEANREKLLSRREAAKAVGVPTTYISGIDPVSTGADAEFSGKNAVMISQTTEGYWVFYEGPKYGSRTHADYWRWFAWANDAVSSGQFSRQYEPRETPETGNMLIFDRLGALPSLVAPPPVSKRVGLAQARTRKQNVLALAGRAGQEVRIELRNWPVAHYRSSLQWDLRDADEAKIDSGTIPYDATETISFVPRGDGVYLLGLGAGNGWYSLVSANVPVGWHAGERLQIIYDPRRLYFHVPKGLTRFYLEIAGSAGREMIRVNVYGPGGHQVATGQTTLTRERVRIPVRVAEPGLWYLETARADEGGYEDHSIRIGPGPSPILSPVREHVFALSSIP